jgi:hypothetical protein
MGKNQKPRLLIDIVHKVGFQAIRLSRAIADRRNIDTEVDEMKYLLEIYKAARIEQNRNGQKEETTKGDHPN